MNYNKNKLKELRERDNISQKKLSEKLSVTEKTISRWENGESQIKPDKAQTLADYFNVDVGYLLGYNEGHQRMYEMFGVHPEKGSMGIIELAELIEVYDLRFIKDEKILDELQRDTTVAIKFLESIQTKLLLYGSISKGHTYRFEEIINFLLDFYETSERRKKELSGNNKN
ncbi:helix-turn-helix transcriptional regulator [Streptococcus himalayensis]|uniref:HTH cro/C1-type domain-containing protein n=1 Tax=Streptococcus himalayensis TaxID=1888195 RepID=A0A917EFV1_9STRE|nr:helix-turn-helix transcriptional regulator [Streptococcus himalayensis]QBX08400.1 DNA-binding protein [Streptococcus satellite phage Javan257]GGE34578.1 hypothetical protein GCM10011510_14870 [Streptococcus himalayensis]